MVMVAQISSQMRALAVTVALAHGWEVSYPAWLGWVAWASLLLQARVAPDSQGDRG